MRNRHAIVPVLASLAALLGVCVHQAQTQGQSGGKVLPVLSTTDVIGYTSPCG